MSLTPLAFDFETSLIRPGCLAPEPACLTWQRPGEDPQILDAGEAKRQFGAWLADPTTLFIGANTAFDMAVAAEAWPEFRPAIFKAYEEDRVTDVQIRQRLLDIAGGVYMGRFGKGGVFIKHTYDLEALAKRIAGIVLAKDEWRLSYGRFIGVPLAKWPERAMAVQDEARKTLGEVVALRLADPKSKELEKRAAGLQSMIMSDPSRCTTYPLDDARATLAVWGQQEVHASYLLDQYRQSRAYWALHLSSAWGIRTDAPGVDMLESEARAEYAEVRQRLIAAGLVREDGSRDTKAAKRLMLHVCARDGLRVRRTDGHAEEGKCKRLDGTAVPDGADECEDHVSLDEESCLVTEDFVLNDYARFSTLGKVLSTDVELLKRGLQFPISPRYGLAETGRTTCSPNIQNLRRQ